MSIYDRLAERARAAELDVQPTSYFSAPEKELDPRLFTANQVLRPVIRNGILSVLYGFWRSRYADAESWSEVYLAGSGVSYQWSAARDPGDLDCLIVVDWVGFRRANEDLRDLGDDELRVHLNHELQQELWPTTTLWHGYELTTYINEGTIETIHPYAAYDVSSNVWQTPPNPAPHNEHNPVWDALVDQDLALAQDIVATYNRAFEEVEGTLNPGLRLNAEITLRTSAQKGAMLFDSIHAGRKKAFSPSGGGYDDFNEYRYKSAKGNGIMGAFREMKQELSDAGLLNDEGTYGVHLPDARELLVATAVARRYKG